MNRRSFFRRLLGAVAAPSLAADLSREAGGESRPLVLEPARAPTVGDAYFAGGGDTFVGFVQRVNDDGTVDVSVAGRAQVRVR